MKDLQKINEQIDRLVDARSRLIDGDNHLALDLALESSVQKISQLYADRKWAEFSNALTGSLELVKQRKFENRSGAEAIKSHASIPGGWPLPKTWGMPSDFTFRRVAPVVIGAKSGVGKSTAARCVIVDNWLNKRRTTLATNEDGHAECLISLFCIMAKIKTGESISFAELERKLNANQSDSTKYTDERKKFDDFVRMSEKFVCIIETEYYSMSRIINALEWSENFFGVQPDCIIVDYLQRVSPEPTAHRQDMRLQMIDASRMIANYIKQKKCVGILISQLNADGKTSESQQFIKDAGQFFVIERDYDEATDRFSETVKIRLQKNRRGRTGRGECFFDGVSGAMIPKDYRVDNSQQKLSERADYA